MAVRAGRDGHAGLHRSGMMAPRREERGRRSRSPPCSRCSGSSSGRSPSATAASPASSRREAPSPRRVEYELLNTADRARSLDRRPPRQGRHRQLLGVLVRPVQGGDAVPAGDLREVPGGGSSWSASTTRTCARTPGGSWSATASPTRPSTARAHRRRAVGRDRLPGDLLRRPQGPARRRAHPGRVDIERNTRRSWRASGSRSGPARREVGAPSAVLAGVSSPRPSRCPGGAAAGHRARPISRPRSSARSARRRSTSRTPRSRSG